MASKKNNKSLYIALNPTNKDLDKIYNLADNVKITPTQLRDLIAIWPLKLDIKRSSVNQNGKRHIESSSKKDPNSNLLGFFKTHFFKHNKKEKNKFKTISFKKFLEIIRFHNTKLSPKEYVISYLNSLITEQMRKIYSKISEIEENDKILINHLKPKNENFNLKDILKKPSKLVVCEPNITNQIIDKAIIERLRLISLIGAPFSKNTLVSFVNQRVKYLSDDLFNKNTLIEFNFYYNNALAEINSYNFFKLFIDKK